MNRILFITIFCATILCVTGLQAEVMEGCTTHVRYRIDIHFQPNEKLITGSEVITWTNYAPGPVQSLPFHLYMNAFESADSTFFKESNGRFRASSFDESHSGYCKIQSFSIDGMGDLTDDLLFIQPDDGNPNDRTVVSVNLPKIIQPDETITVRIKFETKLPKIIARTGWHVDYFLIGQWFPKIGVLEPPGWRGVHLTRWNCHQFHYYSEFYANFADYEVEITFPDTFKVGATGRLVTQKPGPDNTSVTLFRQECVHDFAWTACPDFVVVKEMFTGDGDVTAEEYDEWSLVLDIPVEELKLGNVEITILMHKEHLDFVPLFITTLKNAIKYYGLMFGPYPYDTITMVDPAPGAFGSFGMEYPTFFTAGTHNILEWWPLHTLHAESVIVHEFGHNYWQGMVATNEFEDPWMDEGINSYAEAVIANLVFAPNGHPLDLFCLDSFLLRRSRYIRILPLYDPLGTASWKFYPGQYYGNTYNRTVTMLLTMENIMGRKHFLKTLRAFFHKYRFGHPATKDFVEFFSAKGGDTVRLILENQLLSCQSVDFKVDSVKNLQRDGADGVTNRVKIVRTGQLEVPVDVIFRFEDGTEIRKTWEAKKKNWIMFEFKEKSPLLEVIVDPEFKIALDTNLANNSLTLKPDLAPVGKWQKIAQFVMQALMQVVMLFV